MICALTIVNVLLLYPVFLELFLDFSSVASRMETHTEISFILSLTVNSYLGTFDGTGKKIQLPFLRH